MSADVDGKNVGYIKLFVGFYDKASKDLPWRTSTAIPSGRSAGLRCNKFGVFSQPIRAPAKRVTITLGNNGLFGIAGGWAALN